MFILIENSVRDDWVSNNIVIKQSESDCIKMIRESIASMVISDQYPFWMIDCEQEKMLEVINKQIDFMESVEKTDQEQSETKYIDNDWNIQENENWDDDELLDISFDRRHNLWIFEVSESLEYTKVSYQYYKISELKRDKRVETLNVAK